MEAMCSRRFFFANIVVASALQEGVSVPTLLGQRKSTPLKLARQRMFYIGNEGLGLTTTQLAKLTGQWNKKTVINYLKAYSENKNTALEQMARTNLQKIAESLYDNELEVTEVLPEAMQ